MGKLCLVIPVILCLDVIKCHVIKDCYEAHVKLNGRLVLWQRAVTNILNFVSIGFSEIDQTLNTIFAGGGGGGGGRGGGEEAFYRFFSEKPNETRNFTN